MAKHTGTPYPGQQLSPSHTAPPATPLSEDLDAPVETLRNGRHLDRAQLRSSMGGSSAPSFVAPERHIPNLAAPQQRALTCRQIA